MDVFWQSRDLICDAYVLVKVNVVTSTIHWSSAFQSEVAALIKILDVDSLAHVVLYSFLLIGRDFEHWALPLFIDKLVLVKHHATDLLFSLLSRVFDEHVSLAHGFDRER